MKMSEVFLIDRSNQTPIASEDTLGVVKIGDNLNIAEDGTLSANAGGSSGGSGVGDKLYLYQKISGAL